MNTINESITSKYKEVVTEVNKNKREGMCHEHAVKAAMDKFWYKFILDDRDILLSWFNGKFAA